ncbi:MAG: T9SS type A sorting domain-containing protein, partial [Bacteroidota bacterium]
IMKNKLLIILIIISTNVFSQYIIEDLTYTSGTYNFSYGMIVSPEDPGNPVSYSSTADVNYTASQSGLILKPGFNAGPFTGTGCFKADSKSIHDQDYWIDLWEVRYDAKWNSWWQNFSHGLDGLGEEFKGSDVYYNLAYGIDALISMYSATDDDVYIDSAFALIKNVIDSAKNYNEYDDDYLGWISTGTGKEEQLYEAYLFRYVTKLLRVIYQTPSLYSTFWGQYSAALTFVEEHIWEKWYSRDKVIHEVMNLTSHWAYIAMNLYVIQHQYLDQHCQYYEILTESNSQMHNNISVHPDEPTASHWKNYYNDLSETGYIACSQDVAHANNEVSYISDAHDQGIYWDYSDITAIKNTLKKVIWDGTYHEFKTHIKGKTITQWDKDDYNWWQIDHSDFNVSLLGDYYEVVTKGSGSSTEYYLVDTHVGEVYAYELFNYGLNDYDEPFNLGRDQFDGWVKLGKYDLDIQIMYEEWILNYMNAEDKGDTDGMLYSHMAANARSLLEGEVNTNNYFDSYTQGSCFNADNIQWRVVSGDFDNDDVIDDIAALDNYNVVANNTTKAHVWLSDGEKLCYSYGWWDSGEGNFDPDAVNNRIVSGDFDNDEYIDDIAAFYDYDITTEIHTWLSDGNDFTFEEAWWDYSPNYFEPDGITGRVVSGDFDNDDYIDDIAAFDDYGNNVTRIHAWLSDGDEFIYSYNRWYSASCDATKMTGRVVSGDFDNDGIIDDIAAFYDYGSNTTKLHTWTSNGSTFTLNSDKWVSTGFDANGITWRVVSGDFDHDGYFDDIAACDDYGTTMKIHVWKWNGSNFTYDYGWWDSSPSTFDADGISGRVVSADFDNDYEHYDIAAFHKYPYDTKLRVWVSSGSDFDYSYNWWQICAKNDAFIPQEQENLNEQTESVLISKNELVGAGISVFPNPNSGVFKLNVYGTIDENLKICVIDMTGSTVKIVKVENNICYIDLSSYPKGIYLINALIDGNSYTEKVVVN